jgi:hypothetical protein
MSNTITNETHSASDNKSAEPTKENCDKATSQKSAPHERVM